MALFKPAETSQSNSNGFLGIQEVAITNFENKFDKFTWADVYIEVELRQKNSKYPKLMRIAGSFDFETDGRTIKGGSVLKRIYNLFGALGCTAGISTVGTWEDADGEEIKVIDQFLSENYAASEPLDSYPYLVYIYKEKNPKTNKVYTTVYPKLWENTNIGRATIQKDVEWLKSKNVIKEHIETAVTPDGEATLSGTGIDAL
tara:strand:+ start:1254 stop:1859 length:606 start_codon:yes stop_codon:yes gene_type:complete